MRDRSLRLSHARVLVELREIYDAEREVSRVLDEVPDDLEALDLLGKIKHVRGELSQAIGCWAQVQARAPRDGRALLHLRLLLNLAVDPERRAGDLMAAGHPDLLAKPMVQMELEAAFASFLVGRGREARLRCESLAARHRGDRSVYKLALLASAWIGEMTGDLDGARTLLERLGEERDFARDVDRALALARIYERVGGRDELESAVHIYRYLEDLHGAGLYSGRLATLHRRLGEEEEARANEVSYLDAFRARMQRPSMREVAEVADRHYIPLAQLLEIRFPRPMLERRDLGRRQQAIVDVLAHRRQEARSGFARGKSLLDQKYLADLLYLGGDADAAARAYLELLQQDPSDLRLVSWLLDYVEASDGGGGRVAEVLAEASLSREIERVLLDAIEDTPLRPSLWRRLATFLELFPERREEGLSLRGRAAAHERARRRSLRPIGRVLAAAVLELVGERKGMIHEVWAGREPAILGGGGGGILRSDQIMGNLSREMRQSVKSTFVSVREYARAKYPHLCSDILEYDYTYKVTKEDETSHGISAGVPTAVAFLSVFLQRPVPQDVALTGALVTDAHDVLMVRPVGETDLKIEAAYHRNLRKIVLPEANREALLAAGRIPVSVLEEVAVFASNLDQVVRMILGKDLDG